MIQEFFLPLDRQFDSGFGATASTFHDAAKAIDTDDHRMGFGLSGSRLPVFYLYRHANELYLKSVLTIVHRRFGSNYPRVEHDDFPAINVDGKPMKIFRVHSIRALYTTFKSLLKSNATAIKKVAASNWTDIPEEMDQLVDIIDEADKASTMFRYPITMDPANDAKKSAYKHIHPQAAVAEANARSATGAAGVNIMALKNDDGEIVETFIHDEDPMREVFDALKELAVQLTGTQMGLLFELLSDNQQS